MWNKKEMNQLRWLGYLWPWPWPWIFKVKLYLGNGRPDCHGTKGTGVDRMPWCETLRKWVNWTLRWLGYLWPWILKVKLYLGNGRPHCHGTKGTGVDRMPWCETQPLCDLEAEDTVWGDLRCRRFHRLVLFMLLLFQSTVVLYYNNLCHYLNQCWNIVNLTLRNKLQWNLNPSSHIFILSRPQCVNTVQFCPFVFFFYFVFVELVFWVYGTQRHSNSCLVVTNGTS